MAIGILATWLGLLSILTALGCYWLALLRSMRADTVARAAAAAGDGKEAGSGKDGNGHGNGHGQARRGAGEATTQAPPGIRAPLLLARRAFYVSCASVAVAAITLWGLILNQRYEVLYVWESTNRALPFFYRFAAFWSNQEGTFLLWGIYGSILGLLLLRKAPAEERWVMPFFCLIQSFMFLLMVIMSAFKLHPLQGDLLEAMKQAGIAIPATWWDKLVYALGLAPVFQVPNGNGLNESLQNPWMVIHPPTLFVGYSSMAVPACFAMGALARRDYDGWATKAAPWLSFSWMVLGTGIFLGAYWAYETLGWGGYWAWDPVENSSLMPWIVGTALLHGLLAQRSRGNFKHVNLFLGVLVFLAVLYGSFLTRSGVLAGMSVHSFASPGFAIYAILLAEMALWGLLGFGLWLWRYRDIQSEIAYDSVWERHFGFFLGLIVLSATAAIVAACVSAPILLHRSVQYTYYNRAILPVAFVLMLLMAVTPLAPWRQVRDRARLKPFDRAALVAAGLIVVAFLPAGIYASIGVDKAHYGPALACFAAASVLSLVTNLEMLRRNHRGGILNLGSWIAHVAFCIIMVGIVITSYFSEQQSMEVLRGQQRSAFGWTFTYDGMHQAQPGTHDHDGLNLTLTRGGRTAHMRTPLFVSQIGEGGIMAWPRMLHEWWGDLYVSPNGMTSMKLPPVKQGVSTQPVALLENGDQTDWAQVQFHGFKMDAETARAAMASGAPLEIGADATVTLNGKVYPHVVASRRFAPGLEKSAPIAEPVLKTPEGREYVLSLTDLLPVEQQATFTLATKDVALFTVLRVPGIHVLWFGCYLLIVGGFLTYRRRAVLARPVLRPEAELKQRSRKLRG